MSEFKSAWVIAEGASAINELVSGAAAHSESVTLVFTGDASLARGVSKAYHVEAGSLACCAGAVIKLLAEAAPEFVLTSNSKNGRLLAGMAAAALGATVLTDPAELALEDGGAVASRMVYGGKAFKTEKVSGAPVVACLGPGIFAPADLPEVGEIVELCADTGIAFVDKRVESKKAVNLTEAKKILGVGRGVGSYENLQAVMVFAEKLGADVGCTRPIAEEEKWMQRERYIGVSGVMLKPEVYIGMGISGQVQHMVGVNQAGTVFAVNKDKNAPIFKQCDYGLVADMMEAVQALSDKLG